MKLLYTLILNDDGKAPTDFSKDHLDVDREEIMGRIDLDPKVTSKMRYMTKRN
jgi:hypothetical protein